MTHQPSATQKKAQWGLIIFQFSTDFIKHFLENSIEGLKIWKKNQSYQKKPPEMPSQKLFGPIVCKTLNVIAESAFLSVVTKINVKRQLFTGQILNVFEPRPHRPLGGARLFCDVAGLVGLVGLGYIVDDWETRNVLSSTSHWGEIFTLAPILLIHHHLVNSLC